MSISWESRVLKAGKKLQGRILVSVIKGKTFRGKQIQITSMIGTEVSKSLLRLFFCRKSYWRSLRWSSFSYRKFGCCRMRGSRDIILVKLCCSFPAFQFGEVLLTTRVLGGNTNESVFVAASLEFLETARPAKEQTTQKCKQTTSQKATSPVNREISVGKSTCTRCSYFHAAHFVGMRPHCQTYC